MGRMRSFLWVLAILSLLAALPVSAAPGQNNRPRNTAALVGETSPSLDAERVTGDDEPSLESLRGRVVVLDFWATWCGPCRSVSRYLEGVNENMRDRGLTILGISSEPERVIQTHLRRRPAGYTIAHDRGETAGRFAVQALPTLVVVDRAGKVREVFVGLDRQSARRFSDLLDRLLDEPEP